MANTAAVPRWPFTANCCVKLEAPLVSVMVPAASSSNWLKSRLFRGRSETALPDSFSPPGARACLGFFDQCEHAARGKLKYSAGIARQCDGLRTGRRESVIFDRYRVGRGHERGERECAVASGDRRGVRAARFHTHHCTRDGPAMVVAQDTCPRFAI